MVFSIHVYDQWNNNDIGKYFDLLEAQDIPIIVGEYGSENVNINTLNASTQMLYAAAEREIGRIVWVAKANDNNDLTFGPQGDAQYFDGSNPEILTDLGLLVWQDLQRNEDLSILASGSGYIFEIDSNSPQNTTIVNFGGIGRGINPRSEVVAELDTLKFTGENFTASNLLLTQVDNNLIITFEGDNTTQVTLENFQLENLDNIPKTKANQTELGNIIFNNQNIIEDSFDVFNANSKQKRIWNKNTVTFLNGLNNQVKGFNKSNDTINGQSGNDTISGLGGNDLLRGEIGDDRLLGGKGSDILKGGIGKDRLLGGQGNDILVGQKGNDTLTGGQGEDIFLLEIENINNIFDVITDFQDGFDLIQLSPSWKFEDLIITQGVGKNLQDTLIKLSENNQTIAILSNTNYQSLTEIDFLELS
ncbi:MAG: calcium-binding protein [Prochloraceae cyanobacterium]